MGFCSFFVNKLENFTNLVYFLPILFGKREFLPYLCSVKFTTVLNF